MKTKDISDKDIEQPKRGAKFQYNFPAEGVTVEAESLEEALKELKKLK